MPEEHKRIRSATEKLRVTAREAKATVHEQFAEDLALHARTEEEVLSQHEGIAPEERVTPDAIYRDREERAARIRQRADRSPPARSHLHDATHVLAIGRGR
jgi:hypothetical protein